MTDSTTDITRPRQSATGNRQPATRLSRLWGEIERVARDAGAMSVGASDIDDIHSDVFASWLDDGNDASMHYLARNREARLNPLLRFPWARSVVAITVPYAPERPSSPSASIASRIARYALGDDYHDVLDSILGTIETRLHELASDVRTRRYVDTGPLSDRAHAAQAGLGWIGKNSMLIDPDRGSFFFIGTLLTSLENDIEGEQVADRCGTCTRCIDACPTEAILPDRTIASGQCISYLTIEHRGPIDSSLEKKLAGNIFGCDICQEVCPWNAIAPNAHPAFETRGAYGATPITDLIRFSQSDFSTLFRNSAIKRAKLAGLVRNVKLAEERHG